MKRRGLFVSVAILAILLFHSPSYAQSQEITNGLNYLTSVQNPDGSWGDDISGTEILPSTIAAIETIKALNQTATPVYSNAFFWLQTQGLETSDYFSERIRALSMAGTDRDLLLTYLDDLSGAWGGYDDFEVNNLDTTLALQALNKINYQDQSTISSALFFLNSNQNPDGGFGLYQGDPSTGSGQAESDVYMTALVLQTLSQNKSTYDLKNPIDNAVAYLLAYQNPDGGFGSSPSTVYETALAFESLISSSAVAADKAANIQSALTYLKDAQLPNGSWENDPYSTALALRALANVKPNLSISSSDITFSKPAPIVGDNITIAANIKNTGTAQADNVLIQFYDGNPDADGKLIGAATIITFHSHDII